MSSTTGRGGFPYPDATDGNDIPRDIKALADRLGLVVALFAQGSSRPTDHVQGRFFKWTSGANIGRVDYDDGTGWVTVSTLFAGSGSASTAAHSDHDHMFLGFRGLFGDDSLLNNGTWYPGTLDTEQVDTLNMLSIPVGGSINTVTIPPGYTGMWEFGVVIPVAALAAGGYMQMEVVRNGTTAMGWDGLAPVPETPLALKNHNAHPMTEGDTVQVLRRASNDSRVSLLQTNPRPYWFMKFGGRTS